MTGGGLAVYKRSKAHLGRVRADCIFRAKRHAQARRELDTMANTSSAKKAARQAVRRTGVNKSRRTEMRTYIRKVEEAIGSGNADAAATAFAEAQPRLMRAAQKNLIHKNTASRKVSRLAVRVKALTK